MRLRFQHFAALALVSLVLLPVQGAGPLIAIANPAPAADARFGTGVAGIGDVTADGVPDLVIGAPGADKATATAKKIFGSARAWPAVRLS